MCCEIRDKASAALAFAAAMTGHQVWASLHANDAVSILDRFRDQRVEEYKLTDHTLITGLIGQRLVRCVCPHCRITHAQAQDLGLRSEEHTSELQSLMRISYAVFCLKKKKNIDTKHTTITHTTTSP